VRQSLLPLLTLSLLAACSRPAPEAGRAFSATGEVIALSGGEAGASKACFVCHGLDGHGDGASAPRLAGLDAGYLQKQLEDYAATLRPDPVMTPIAKRLTAEDRRAVALYYARRPAKAGEQALSPPAAYETCARCHGAQGQGIGAANPTIAGQPAGYTLEQLRRWRTAERRNDPSGVMVAAARSITDQEARAIAAWLEQADASRAPDTSAASLSDAGAAAAQWAASRAARHPGR